VTLAGQVGVVGHIEIGDQAIVAAKSGVSKSVPPKGVVFGYPAGPIQEYKEELACIARLPKLYARVRKVEQVLDSQKKSSPPES
jgi:UDP-3-O-[3-hydroxymyristoyl] glucosamine N-acyltransferase